MSVDLLTPLAALIVLAGVLPLLATRRSARRAAAVRRELGLEPRRRSRFPAAATVGAAALVGLAAAQPIVEYTTRHDVRTDAEAYVVLDVSRSMLARRDQGRPRGSTGRRPRRSRSESSSRTSRSASRR